MGWNLGEWLAIHSVLIQFVFDIALVLWSGLVWEFLTKVLIALTGLESVLEVDFLLQFVSIHTLN